MLLQTSALLGCSHRGAIMMLLRDGITEVCRASGYWSNLGGLAEQAAVAALEALRNNCRLRAVRASCHEVYGEVDEPPAQAIVYFRGVDEQFGAMTKYAIVEPYAYT